MSPAERLAIEVSPGVLARLLDLTPAGDPSLLSARPDLGPAARLGPDDVGALVGAGVLDAREGRAPALTAGFAAVASALLRPRVTVTVRVWSGTADHVTTVHFPDTLRAGSGVALNRLNGVWRVVAPIEGPGLLALVDAGFLDALPAVEGQPFGALLEPAVATALTGVADWSRTRDGRAAAGSARASLEPAALVRWLDGAGGPADLERFGTYLALALGRRVALDAAGAERALARLHAAGLVTRIAAGYGPSGTLAELASPEARIEGALHWHVLRAIGPDTVEVTNRVALAIGGRLLLTLEAVEDGVLIRAPSPGELAAWLRAEVDSGPAAPRAAAEASAVHAPLPAGGCPSCGASVRPGVVYCTSCGLDLRASRCPGCGAEPRAGLAFCTRCGARLAAGAR